MKNLACIFSLCTFLCACADPPPQSGQASHTWANENQYVGEFKDGNPHGQGTFTWPNGSKYVGESKNNKPWEGMVYNKDGNHIETVSAGFRKPVN